MSVSLFFQYYDYFSQTMPSSVSVIIFMNYNMLIFIDLKFSLAKWAVICGCNTEAKTVLIPRILTKWTENSSRLAWIM